MQKRWRWRCGLTRIIEIKESQFRRQRKVTPRFQLEKGQFNIITGECCAGLVRRIFGIHERNRQSMLKQPTICHNAILTRRDRERGKARMLEYTFEWQCRGFSPLLVESLPEVIPLLLEGLVILVDLKYLISHQFLMRTLLAKRKDSPRHTSSS